MNTKNLLSIEFWLWNLVRAFVTGSVQAGGAALGIIGAESVGINVPTLTLRQIGIIFVWGGISGTVIYLMKSPLPPIDIEQPTQTNEQTKPNPPAPNP